MEVKDRYTILIIGGGATGTGLARDLALRGMEAILVEREDLASGTTGKNHGILHSGARYVVADPPSATECAQENPIISRIARHIVEDFGGYYILTEEDDPLYRDEFVSACRRTGVRITEVAPQKLLEKEPYLTPRIKRSYRIQDKAIDMFRLCVLNAYDASFRGANVRTYTEVEGFRISDGLIQAVKVRDTLSGEQYEIKADVVVNAAGPWAGIVANMAGEELPLRPSKGTLVVTERRIFNSSAIGHLRYPSDGDLILSHNAVSILGTTSIDVDDPDLARPAKEETFKIIREGCLLAPSLRETRFLRSFASARPLLPAGEERGRQVSRTFAVVEHKSPANLVTVAGGKASTYRLMAQAAADLICKRLGIDADCTTHRRYLPGAEHLLPWRKLSGEGLKGQHRSKALYWKRFNGGHSKVNNYLHTGVDPGNILSPASPEDTIEKKYPYLSEQVARRTIQRWGSLAEEILSSPGRDQIVCSCEFVTRAEVEFAIDRLWARNIEDIRRRTRLGMGLCQGTECVDKLLPVLLERGWDIKDIHVQARDFLDRRWRGCTYVAWGDQLRQLLVMRHYFLVNFGE